MDGFHFPTPAITAPSPTTSETDEFNTSSARLHFGPLKSPERRFIPDLNTRTTLFPHAQSPPLRRSPRLSSPRLRSQSPQPSNDPDVDEVELLVQLGDEEDEEGDSSRFGTPEKNTFLEDEPPSALADRVLRAHDNPSPPPSPSLGPTLDEFDPLREDSAESSFTPTGAIDLFLFNASDQPQPGAAPLAGAAYTPHLTPTRSIPMSEDLTASNISQQDLISFDSFSTPASDHQPVPDPAPHADVTTSTLPLREPSVDELLSRSPSPVRRDAPIFTASAPLIVVDPPQEEVGSSAVLVEDLIPWNEEEQQAGPSRHLELQQNSNDDEPNGASSSGVSDIEEAIVETPLRRSTRPRRSVSPNIPTPQSTNVEITANIVEPPSSARTQRKKKLKSASFDDDVPDSCGETNEDENATTTKEISTPVTAASSERMRGKERSPGKTPQLFHRELGSLSPTSTDLLSRLVPTLSNTEDGETQPMPSFSIFPLPSQTLPSTPIRSSPMRSPSPARSANPARSTSPVRSNSPSRSKEMPQPSSKQLKPNLPSDTYATPARRIPIEQAIAQGHISPQKAAQLGNVNNLTGPRFGIPRTPVFTIPSVDSPARRVAVAGVSAASAQKRQQSTRFASPIRAKSKEVEQSVEPWPLSKDKVLNNAGPSSLVKTKPSKLPFPLVASGKPEEATKDSQLTASTSSPVKSSLKQPTSRIPRIGTKPYARPTAASLASEKAKTGGTMRIVDLGKPGEASTSNTASKNSLPTAGGAPKDASNDTIRVHPSSTLRLKAGEAPPAATLKRKRGPEKPSPTKPRSMVMIRQVPPVATAKPAASSSRQAASSGASAVSQTKKGNGVVRIRRVVDREPTIQANKATPKQSSELPPSAEISKEEGSKSECNDKPAEIAQPVEAALEPGSPMVQDPVSSPPPSSQELTSEDVPSTAPVPDGPLQSVRRTTRVRKPVQPTSAADVFGEGSTRPLQRRKVNTQPVIRYDDAFSGMSATALKALTTTNTARNQTYLAAKLETEVIRKEGARPESPVVKVRTISQRQEDEKGRQRKERAERRARRNENDSPQHSDGDDLGYSSALEGGFDDYPEGDGSPLRRYRRGPGDEEDYESPERPEKKAKLVEEARAERRVKWDRGLYTTVYLDEVQLGARLPPQENIVMKGCLAPTAKAVRLDTLGNLPNAESPLKELVQENIVVKKFVYDNDEPPEEVVVVKNTRSRMKKNKS